MVSRGWEAVGRRAHDGAEFCTAKQYAAVALGLGLEAAAGGDVRAQRGAGRQLKEAAGILGMRATDGKFSED